MNKHVLSILGAGLIAFGSVGLSGATEATILFTDDFNDGSYLDTWLLDYSYSGNPTGSTTSLVFDPPEVICSNGDCYLEGHTTNDLGHTKNAAIIYINNPTTTGGWQFDSKLSSTEGDHWNFLILSDDHTPFNGNYYFVLHSDTGVKFTKRIGPTYTDLISADWGIGQDDQWYTITINRDNNAQWTLFVNGTLIGSTIDSSITNMPYLMVGRYGAYDNITVISASTFQDNDEDGFTSESDCDDNNPFVNPGVVELPGNIEDENCDGDLGDCWPCYYWRNHGEYVRCTAYAVDALIESGQLTDDEGSDIVSTAAQTSIGKKGYTPPECK